MDKYKKIQDLENRRLQNKVSDLQKQLDQKNIEVQGEGQEEIIEEFIRRKFPGDSLESKERSKWCRQNLILNQQLVINL